MLDSIRTGVHQCPRDSQDQAMDNQDMANNILELANGFKLQVIISKDCKARRAFSNSMQLEISSSSSLALALAVLQHRPKEPILNKDPTQMDPSCHSLVKEVSRDLLAR